MIYPCAQVDDLDIYFVEMDPEVHGTVMGRKRTALAVNTCQKCPIMEECGKKAMEDPSLRGVMGGMTEAQRRVRSRSAYRSA